MIKVRVTSASDSDLDIENGAVPVVVRDIPTTNGHIAYPILKTFENDSGQKSLAVDGTVPVDFAVQALPDYDLYIQRIDLRISHGGAQLNEFGNLPELTNGLQLIYYNTDIGEIQIGIDMKSNMDLVRMFPDTPALGSGNTAFKADATGSGSDTYLCRMNVPTTYGGSNGIFLRKNTTDRIALRVRDDLSNVTVLDAFITGRFI